MGVKQKSKSLKSRKSDLSQGQFQLNVLNGKDIADQNFKPFELKIKEDGYPTGIFPDHFEIFQLNIGKLCNQTCAHCHVDAGPDRKEENMDRSTLEQCLKLIKNHNFSTVDITGGAPEMNPHFKWFVSECAKLGKKIINRCNLTIIKANKKYNDLPQFFADHNVEIVSSLPFYSKSRTDAQRGDGVFEDSIEALKMLNGVGYGKPDSSLKLHLVYNPTGAFLPGNQQELERTFKSQLKRKFDIDFHYLYAITNQPISRFLDYLLESNNYSNYMQELVNAYNPGTLEGLMCKNTLSISWDGYIYDCDFNQMLEMKSDVKKPHINDFDPEDFKNRKIKLNQHCYACTAGGGSSCGGEIN